MSNRNPVMDIVKRFRNIAVTTESMDDLENATDAAAQEMEDFALKLMKSIKLSPKKSGTYKEAVRDMERKKKKLILFYKLQ